MSLYTTQRALRKGWFAKVVSGDLVSRFYFQYNPTEMTTSYGVNYNFISPPGSSLPTATFGNIEGDKISLSLLLDSTVMYDKKKYGVTAQKALLGSLVSIDVDQYISSTGSVLSPPEIIFGFGKFTSNVVVTSLTMKDVRFNTDLIPTRTEVDIEMQAIFTSMESFKYRMEKMATLRDLVIVKEKLNAPLQGF